MPQISNRILRVVLFEDDAAKIGSFFEQWWRSDRRRQVLESGRLMEPLFRSDNAADAGVPILGGATGCARPAEVGQRHFGGKRPSLRKWIWGKHLKPVEFPEYQCDFWATLMAGYGGNIVALLPNGSTLYVFRDGRPARTQKRG